ncbi:DNA polymerase III subunit alpha [Methylobacter sp.]|uniref:DNA polymerase III subunit alpha n=1 Tax=Methylobacter sp. TaxID=2051955 RepID=UPI0024872249|nr:DNA polymerase III subunit alpha [Methylobacter sp.]MDI1276330.1 DNA polymerase III subunit alpha [Methylobacter sp.]MDI1357070.1 DNA polymerase III subunit alpha [Methylobacter sp.]
MQPAFVHLRLHTEFSLVDGIVKIKPLVKRLAELNMPSVAVTEHANLFSLVKFYKAALGQGIKAIAGSDVLVFNPEDPATPYRLTLLVNNHAGYITLTELISKAYQEGQHQGVPMLRQEWIEANHNGLIALSGAMSGCIGKALLAENHDAAKRLAEFWGTLFEQSFYLELQRVGKPEEERYIAAAVELALATGLPVVATNDVRFVYQQDFAAHEVRVCINQGRVLDDTRRPKDYTDQQYLRSVEEMQALFADIPEALENTVEIAKRCNLKLTLGQNFLPDFPVPEGMNLGEFMAAESMKGLEERLQHYPAVGKGTDEENRRVYYDRLDFELKMITQMGFPGYFMIVADFIQWAKNNLIPVGPGRGSGAGSLVAYALKITDLDPIEFDLLFERFLNPERVSMPDFDVDFCMDRRDEVIDYVARHYGRDHVAQIITYGSMAAKAVIRDVGRVLGFGYGFVDRLSKLVPFEIGMTLTKALKDSPELKQLYDTEEEVKALIDMALSLEGTSRNAGKHAGGVVISPTKLTDFTPLYCDQDGNNLVTQFDKDDVEAVGLVKFDFLGLRTLTIIDWALQDINAKQEKLGKPLVDITIIPRDDPASYKLLTAAQTTAVFQLESRGMKELIKKLKPDCFDDIIALVALFRPGPLESGMVDDYINVKHGAKAEYAHPLLEPILKPTNGVILYQEQVMQIAREMALYTLGGADMLRRAMGKKKPEEMAKERDKFTAGAIENQVDEKIATYVFDLMEKFAGYGFNKSHSAAYALVAYQTAWLKAHYQPEFMAAVMSADMDNTDKVVILIEECKQMKLEVCPPTINVSKYKFTVNDAGHIVYGLGALKGVGEAAIEEMLIEREANGLFSGLYDLCKRVDLRKFNRRVLEALIRAGAFDEFDDNRAGHLAELPTVLKVAEQHGKNAQTGQNDLFGLAVNAENIDDAHAYATVVEPWSENERLAAEKLVLGLFLTGHPINQYEAELRQFTNGTIESLLANVERSKSRKMEARTAGLVVEVRTRQTKNGKIMGFATIDDRTGRLEIAAFGEVYDKYRSIFTRDSLLIAEGALGVDDYLGTLRLTVEKLYSMEQAREVYARSIQLVWNAADNESEDHDFVTKLIAVLEPFKGGGCPVGISYTSKVAKASLQLGDEWRVQPTDELVARLRALLGSEAVEVKYR